MVLRVILAGCGVAGIILFERREKDKEREGK